MDGAKKVMIGGVAIIGIIVIGPMLPGILARTTKGGFQFVKVVGQGLGMFYEAGQKSGMKKVTSGIAEPMS